MEESSVSTNHFPGRGKYRLGACDLQCHDQPCSSDVINLLSSDSTYLNDPNLDEREEFDAYFVMPGKVRNLLRQFPSLQMRIDHYKLTAMTDEGERIIKRILFKIDKLQSREKDDDDMVIVSSPGTVLVEVNDSGEFEPLSE